MYAHLVSSAELHLLFPPVRFRAAADVSERLRGFVSFLGTMRLNEHKGAFSERDDGRVRGGGLMAGLCG